MALRRQVECGPCMGSLGIVLHEYSRTNITRYHSTNFWNDAPGCLQKAVWSYSGALGGRVLLPNSSHKTNLDGNYVILHGETSIISLTSIQETMKTGKGGKEIYILYLLHEYRATT